MLGGRPYTLCLTLGALAELEDAFQCGDMAALVDRFARGTLSARDAVRVIGAGLRGAGHPVSDEEVAGLSVDGGAVGFAQIVSALLAATFGTAEGGDPS